MSSVDGKTVPPPDGKTVPPGDGKTVPPGDGKTVPPILSPNTFFEKYWTGCRSCGV